MVYRWITNTYRQCLLGDVIQMDYQHIPQLALYWDVLTFTRPDQPTTNWTGSQDRHMKIGTQLEQTEAADLNTQESFHSVAQCNTSTPVE